MVNITIEQLIMSGTELVKYWRWNEVTSQEHGLSSERKKDTVLGMSGAASIIWTLASVKRAFV